jgi:hypothetical protein
MRLIDHLARVILRAFEGLAYRYSPVMNERFATTTLAFCSYPQVLSATLDLFTFGITIENNDGPSSVAWLCMYRRPLLLRYYLVHSFSATAERPLLKRSTSVLGEFPLPTLRRDLAKWCFDLYTHLKLT